jgi:exonuclease III
VSHRYPSILCLQETHICPFHSLTLRGFEIYSHDHLGGERANDGTAILVLDCVYSVSVPPHTTLQALAVRITLGALSFTICNIYLPPALPIAHSGLVRLISQLPTPFVLLGDFNAKHIVWSSDINDDRGVLIHDLYSRLDLSLLNSGAFTHFSLASRTSPALDLTFCSPALSTHLEWPVLCDLHSSDHFPVNFHIASSRL